MRLQEVLKGIEIISHQCDLNLEITGVACDSRKVRPGYLFVAIAGYETDGFAYIAKACEAGAVAVLSNRVPEGIAYIQMENPRRGLALAAANFYGRPAETMTMIGVTGTNGKTTVTYLMKALLEVQGAKVGLIGTNQNMIGDEVISTERTTPESCELQALFRRMADAGCTHVVMEVSSHSLVLDRVYGIPYEIGIFTNITQDHLDFHKTMDSYLAAKALLFGQCRIGVLNYDDSAFEQIAKDATCEVVTYSAKYNHADVTAKNILLKPDSVQFEAVGFDSIGRIELHVPGEFSVYNALAVVSSALALGIPIAEISRAMREVSGVKGRAEVVPTPTDYTVMIDYAHTPDALKNILQTVRDVAEGRVIAVFGCGGDRDRTKRPKMGKAVSELADFAVITSDNPRTEDPMKIIEDILPGVTLPESCYVVEPDRRAAIHYALKNAQAGDIIVLAGKGHETYQEIHHIKHHMDERELVAEFFK